MDKEKFDDLITELRKVGDPSDRGRLLDELVEVVNDSKPDKPVPVKGKKKG
jgi:hypothetical protein